MWTASAARVAAMNIGILLALGSAVAYGASDFIGGVGSRTHSPWQVVLVGQAAGAVLMLAAGLTAPGTARRAGLRVGAPGWRRLGDRQHLPLPRSRPRPNGSRGADLGGRCRGPARAGAAFPSAIARGWLVLGRNARRTSGHLAGLPQRLLGSPDSTPAEALLDGALAGVGFGVLFIALAQISMTLACMPLAVNQLAGAILTILTAVGLKQTWRPSSGRARLGEPPPARSAPQAPSPSWSPPDRPASASPGVLASLYPAVTVLLAACLLRERVTLGQRAGIGLCTLAVAAMALG